MVEHDGMCQLLPARNSPETLSVCGRKISRFCCTNRHTWTNTTECGKSFILWLKLAQWFTGFQLNECFHFVAYWYSAKNSYARFNFKCKLRTCRWHFFISFTVMFYVYISHFGRTTIDVAGVAAWERRERNFINFQLFQLTSERWICQEKKKKFRKKPILNGVMKIQRTYNGSACVRHADIWKYHEA